MEVNQEFLKKIEQRIDKLEKQNKSFEETISVLKEELPDKKLEQIPISIFNNTKLSALETIVKYLKEDLHQKYIQIATVLNRNYHPIAITYRNSIKKMPESLDVSNSKKIPLKIFENKKLSILENIITFLKEKMLLSNHQIAVLVKRDDRTIWTVYQRSLKKRKDETRR